MTDCVGSLQTTDKPRTLINWSAMQTYGNTSMQASSIESFDGSRLYASKKPEISSTLINPRGPQLPRSKSLSPDKGSVSTRWLRLSKSTPNIQLMRNEYNRQIGLSLQEGKRADQDKANQITYDSIAQLENLLEAINS